MIIPNHIRKLTLASEIANESYDVFSPNDHNFIASVELPNSNQIEKAISEVTTNFKRFSDSDIYLISKILSKVAKKIKKNADYLAYLIASEGGKPLKDAKVEVQRAESTLRECAMECFNLKGEIIEMNKSPRGKNKNAYTKLFPIGPVLAISAFNHPLNLICHQVGTAIAARCTIILKPAPNTALCSFELYNYFMEAGLDYGIFHILPLDGESTSKIVSDKRFKYVNFIGSEKVGWNIWKNVYPGTKVQFEHGGVGTAVVLNDANIDKAIPSLITSSFYHSGQVCVSTQNIYLEKGIYSKFKEKFIECAKLLKVGDARDINTDCGPIIKKESCDRIEIWVDEAMENGANAITGGHRISDNYYSVTILENVKRGMKVYEDEIFGPVVNFIGFDNLENVIEEINSSEFAFQTCIFTSNLSKALNYAHSIDQKACMVNEHNAFRVDWMPFGGYKKSGYGVSGVKYAIHDLQVEKLIILNNI